MAGSGGREPERKEQAGTEVADEAGRGALPGEQDFSIRYPKKAESLQIHGH
jgi:hypothetical protein